MDINFENTKRNADPDKARLTLEELAQGRGGGLAVDIRDVSINVSDVIGSDPLAQYAISDIDEATSTKYYGYLNEDGGWYIMKEVDGAYTYVKGNSAYTTAWTGRASQTYGNFDAIF
jgi:hypothetical protein